ncbi:hypothetical protein QTP86_026728 [Hemibagrus guttatus]|nr:hypothetical protein QTP86_026728 [Hemibagrus guttatus]
MTHRRRSTSRRGISDQSLANNIITHLKSLRSLYIMCHIPVFCWISATVLERMLGKAESGEIPKTLTQMYTHFLIIQTNIIREKYSKKQESDEEMLLKLGQLAFQQLKKGNLIFYEEDLRECGIDVREAAVYSGVCTQIFRKEFGLHQSKVYCFVHLSIQEHLAALYVHLTFMKEKRNVLKQNQVSKGRKNRYKKCPISQVHKSAVDQTLKSQTGHLDLFLRFFLGLSLESNQKLLHALVTQTGSSSQGIKRTVQYIKEKISEDVPTEKSINLFHCLNELGDNSLVEEIQHYLKSGKQSELSSSQWSALVFVLLTSAQELEEFDLSKYFSTEKITETVVVKMMPVIAASRKAIISCDTLGGESWSALDSALRSETSNLRELHLTVKTLDLTGNNLRNSGVKSLSVLENPHCKLETLGLCKCGVSDEGCAALTSALRSNPSHLRNLDLSCNNLGVSGVKSLSAVLENPHCKLETLELCECDVSDEGCAALTSALRSNPSHLRHLDLSWNNVGDSGVKSLSAVLENPHCKLEKLGLCKCGVSGEGCAALTSALRSNPSHLRYLDLSWNNLGDSGVKSLSAGLENPHCKLETLNSPAKKLMLSNVPPFISDEAIGKELSRYERMVSLIKKIPLGCKSPMTLNVLNVVKLDILLGPALRGRVTPVFLSDRGGARPSRLESLPLWPRSGPAAEGPGAATAPDLTESVPQAQPAAQKPTGATVAPEKPRTAEPAVTEPRSAQLDRKKPWSTEKSSVGSGAVLEPPALTEACTEVQGNRMETPDTTPVQGDGGDVDMVDVPIFKVPNKRKKQESGDLFSEPTEIRKQTVSFYSKLYSSEWSGAQVVEDSFLVGLPKLSERAARELDRELSLEELHEALQRMENGWVSGIDGLSAEFYKAFWAVIGQDVLDILRDSVWLWECGVSNEGCAALTSALRSNPSHLRYLNLSENNLGDSGVKSLSAVLENPHCKLETLGLYQCGVSDEGCAALTSALRSNPSHLRDLNLSCNNLGDSGVKSLSAVLENPHCKLETLGLCKCDISDEGCAALTSALRSNPSHLRELNLSENNLEVSGKKLLSALKDDEHYKLQTLMLK